MQGFYAEPAMPSIFQRALAYGIDLFSVGMFPLILLVALLNDVPAEFFASLLVIDAVYYIVPTIVFGGTPAKLLNGLRVRMQDGSRITPDAAILRYLVLFLTFMVPLGVLISFVFVVLSPQRLAIHDRIAGTIVTFKD